MENDCYVVGIGASAGGMEALRTFFSQLPPNLPAAFVVITHLMREHRSILDSYLRDKTEMAVVRCDHDMGIEPGMVYVLPENTHVTIRQRILRVHPRSNEIINHAIDIFLSSLATDCGSKAIAVVLSGRGSDGLEGSRKVSANGGTVLVQSPESAYAGDMPQAIITGDHPREISSPGHLAEKLASLLLDRNKT